MNRQRRVSVTFEEDVLTAITDPNKYVLDNNINSVIETSTTEIGVQTDSGWLDMLKKELSVSMKLDQRDGLSSKQKSKTGTIRSHTTTTKRSVSRSKKTMGNSTVEETSERGSIISSDDSTTIPAYPEMIVNDEYGLSFLDSSDDEHEIDMRLIVEQQQQMQPQLNRNQKTTELVAMETNLLADAGLPASLRPSKELGILDHAVVSPRSLQQLVVLQKNQQDQDQLCEFCGKAVLELPTSAETQTRGDPAQIFCCQKYRDLVSYAIQKQQQDSQEQQQTGGSRGSSRQESDKKSERKLIDVSPGKSFKSEIEVAEAKLKSEKKEPDKPVIKERILARQQQELLAAQMARQQRIDAAQQRHTTMPESHYTLPADDENSTFRTVDSVQARQMKCINYQLSDCDFLKNGWTKVPIPIDNNEFMLRQQLEEQVIAMDLTTGRPEDIFSHSNWWENQSMVAEYYPDGSVFLILFQDGSGNIYYPSGNLAIVFMRDASSADVISVIREDSPMSDSKSRILGIVNTKGYGTFNFEDGKTRLLFDMLMGVELHRSGDRKRQWFWDGKPHVHAPPFQPIFFSINRHIGIRISAQGAVFVNFLGLNRHLHINVGCRTETPKSIQQQMLSLAQVQSDKLLRPLLELRQRIHNLLRRCHEALDRPVSLGPLRGVPQQPRHKAQRETTTFSLSLGSS